jgi:hypothetical protein
MLSSRILKGGAMLGDSRRLAEVWNPAIPADQNLRIAVERNLLGKGSRSRALDVIAILRARFVDPGSQVMVALQTLASHPMAFREACFYETARVDSLLAAFAEDPLYAWFSTGRTLVSVEDTVAWITDLIAAGRVPPWSEKVRVRAAQGLLSTLRDFGVLQGSARKHLASPGMSPVGFAYAAYREQEQERSSRAREASQIGRLWLRDGSRVGELMAQAERRGVQRYSQAGSVVRIDWRVSSLDEVARAAA